ncbi:hypothetical protein [Motilimonas eburnea]|uniref:hypothetical protein n=1 Tax=Motilimonas eburnea TaxID=1737488 RepID=UPI001E600A82|nr:hypothetical protein [Motilimonas eburnea]MCE2571676.1 hypothetical protein [Motilimonas eburnea]
MENLLISELNQYLEGSGVKVNFDGEGFNFHYQVPFFTQEYLTASPMLKKKVEQLCSVYFEGFRPRFDNMSYGFILAPDPNFKAEGAPVLTEDEKAFLEQQMVALAKEYDDKDIPDWSARESQMASFRLRARRMAKKMISESKAETVRLIINQFLAERA